MLEQGALVAVVLGAIGIILSLIYIGRQMKEATRQRRIDSHHSILAELDDFCKLVAHDNVSADIWWRATNGLRHLTDAERVRYFAMLFILFRTWEKAFRYRTAGELEEWTADIIMKPMVDFTSSDGVQEYWALRKRWYTPDFREWVDKQVRERSGIEIYGEQFRIFGSAVARDDSKPG
jgi:hypothetical protein